MPAVGTAIQAGEELFKIGYGAVENAKAKKEAAILRKTRPKASLNPEIRAEADLAKSELAKGISSESEQAWKDSTDRGLATSISAILKSGGTPNNISDVFSNTAEGRQRFAMFKEQTRQSQLDRLTRAYEQQANDEKAVFDYNSRQWFDDAQANAARKQSAQNMMFSGISGVGSAASGYASMANSNNQTDKTLAAQKDQYTSYQDFQEKMYDKYFGKSNSSTEQVSQYLFGNNGTGTMDLLNIGGK